jgi:hypothetical protein
MHAHRHALLATLVGPVTQSRRSSCVTFESVRRLVERTPGSAQNHHQLQYDTFEGLLEFQQRDEAAGRVEVTDEF